VVFCIVAFLAGHDPAGGRGPIQQFPEIRAVRILENGLISRSSRWGCRWRSRSSTDLSRADGAAPAEQTALALLWQAKQGMFDSLLLVGLLMMPPGAILLGLAMSRDQHFGKAAGATSVVFGTIGLACDGHAGRSAVADRRARRPRLDRIQPRRRLEDLLPPTVPAATRT
jgi:hypothetical protein